MGKSINFRHRLMFLWECLLRQQMSWPVGDSNPRHGFSSWLGNCWPSGRKKNTQKGELSRASRQWKVFWTFFLHVLRYQFETWYIHLVGSATDQVTVSSQLGHYDLLYSQERVRVIFRHLWPQKLYRAFRFCTHTYIASVLTHSPFCHGWAIFYPLVGRMVGISTQLQQKVLCAFFTTYFDIWTWNLVYASDRWHDTSSLSFIAIRSLPLEIFPDFLFQMFEVSTWKLIHTFSRLHHILSWCFTRMGSLWPTSCS